MVKNTTGGNRHKKQKNTKMVEKVSELILIDNRADVKQVYAQVIKKLGGKRLLVNCSDGKERSCIIPGAFFRRCWMNVGDVLLCDLNPIGNDDTKCAARLKYDANQVSSLRSMNLLTFIETLNSQEQLDQDEDLNIEQNNDLANGDNNNNNNWPNELELSDDTSDDDIFEDEEGPNTGTFTEQKRGDMREEIYIL